MSRLSDDDLDFLEGKRLRRMGINPDGDPGEIAREVERQYKEVRAKYEQKPDAPVSVEPQRRAFSVPGTASRRDTERPSMAAPPKQVILTAAMTYRAALALIAETWPRLPVLIYEPTVEHYKEGYPTAEELELGPDELLGRVPGREAVICGDMTGQSLHHAVMTAFGKETHVRGVGIRAIWATTLDEADAGRA